MTTLLSIALGLLLQSTVLLLPGLLALHLTKRRGPAVQSLVGRATLAGIGLSLLLAAPLTGHVRPLWRATVPAVAGLPVPDTDATPHIKFEEPTPPQAAPLPKEEGEPVIGSRVALLSPRLPKNSSPGNYPLASPSPLGRVAVCGGVGFFAAWGLGTALLLLWLGICHCHLTRLRRQARPLTSGLAAETLAALTAHPPTLLAHPSVRSPFLAGLCRPAIFLPTTYDTDFDPPALRAILVHELTHLARCDAAWTLAARLLCALLWPQPLLWGLCRRLEQIGEEACDQAVLARDCPPRAYAACLLTLAERHPLGRRERALGAGVAPFRSSLGRRIARILDKGTHPMSPITLRLRLTLAALTLAAALGGAFLVSSAPAQSSKTVSENSAASVVQNYLNALRAGHYDNAYAFLSPDTQREIPLAQFRKADNEITQRLQNQDARAPVLKALSGLFFDTHGVMGYHYTVIGISPTKANEPNLTMVQVSAQGPGLPAGGTEIQIGLLADAGGAKMDSRATYFFAPPATFNHASLRLTDLHCDINMKQVGLAIWHYSYHHNDRFPDADRWMDEIKPYLKTEAYYHDPAAPDSERYSYAYNRNLSSAAADRVSNMSGTIMLFESSLNVRNASDTGQSLIEPARHSKYHNLMFVNGDGHAKDGQPLSFALHIAPPSFYATASLEQLVRLHSRTQSRLVSEQSAFDKVHRQFEGELSQAVPQANTATLAQTRNLEMGIGLQVMELQNIAKLRSAPTPNRPSALSWDWHHAERWTESQLRPLLAQEALLLPNVPGAQLTRLHLTAAALTNSQFTVGFLQSEITQFHKEIERRRRQEVKP